MQNNHIILILWILNDYQVILKLSIAWLADSSIINMSDSAERFSSTSQSRNTQTTLVLLVIWSKNACTFVISLLETNTHVNIDVVQIISDYCSNRFSSLAEIYSQGYSLVVHIAEQAPKGGTTIMFPHNSLWQTEMCDVWCVARVGVICTILKTCKTSMEECFF